MPWEAPLGNQTAQCHENHRVHLNGGNICQLYGPKSLRMSLKLDHLTGAMAAHRRPGSRVVRANSREQKSNGKGKWKGKEDRSHPTKLPDWVWRSIPRHTRIRLSTCNRSHSSWTQFKIIVKKTSYKHMQESGKGNMIVSTTFCMIGSKWMVESSLKGRRKAKCRQGCQ